MVAKSKKKSVRVGGVTKRKGTNTSGSRSAPAYRPPSHVLVHGDIGGEYEYDLEAGIDIGALGDNIMSMAAISKDSLIDAEHEDGQGNDEDPDQDQDELEDVINVTSKDEHIDIDAEFGQALGTAGDIKALLEDFDRQEGAANTKRNANSDQPSTSQSNVRNTLYDRIPWSAHACLSLRSPTLRLHEEIRMFNSCLRPTDEEQQARNEAVDRIRKVVVGLWPEARLEVFGSFATGLYLPSSDIDAVILDSKCADIRQGLRVLAKSLSKKSLAVEMQTILKARVPIVKFVEKASGYNFDISFDVANGPEAAEIVLRLIDVMPAMSHLVMVLKVFLQQRELSEVYTGGIGSYALLVMVANFMQTHRSRFVGGEKHTNLGELLIDFFRLHGRTLANSVGLSCSEGGKFFKKRQVGFHQPERPELYAVQDPNDDDNDLGKNSYNASKVRVAFDHAYSRLTASVKPGESLLERIVRLDKILFSRWVEVTHDLCCGTVALDEEGNYHEEEAFVRNKEAEIGDQTQTTAVMSGQSPKAAAKPGATKTRATESKAAKTRATKTRATKPRATESKAAKTRATKTRATESRAAKTKGTKTRATESKAAKTRATESKAAKTKGTKPRATKPKAKN